MAGAYAAEQAARQIWLLYYNQVLLEQGIITAKEYRQMKIKIQGNANRD